MDISLEKSLDGIDAAKEIRSALNIPVVFLTGLADSDTLEQAKAAEPLGYIVKPINPKELVATIEMALSQFAVGTRRAERVRRDSDAIYHSLVENLPQNIFRKDLEGRFTFANQRFCRTTGRSLEEILGKSDFDLYPAGLAEKYRADDLHVFRTGESFEAVEQHQDDGSSVQYVRVIKTPLYDSQGKRPGHSRHLLGHHGSEAARRKRSGKVRSASGRLQRPPMMPSSAWTRGA